MLTLRPTRDLATSTPTLDRFFNESVNRFFGNFGEEVSSRTWNPPVDIYEEGDNILIHAELPGFEKNDVNINVENGRLSISGERTFQSENESRDYHRMERWYGKFHRTFQLPNTVDLDSIDATLKNGILTISIPKREEAKPRQIKVKA